MQIIRLSTQSPELRAHLTEVWEASVRSTHHFLSDDDIRFFKPQVRDTYLAQTDVYGIMEEAAGKAMAFIGLGKDKIEMLFVHPDQQGKGLGTALINFAVRTKGVHKVDVNEQNSEAHAFYKKTGFVTTSRDEYDPSGRPFPILHMELSPERTRHTEISAIREDRKQYLPLLLTADEQENMIDRYLDRGAMYAMRENGRTVCVCVVTDEGRGVCEIKNIAVDAGFRFQGYGKRMIEFAAEKYGKTHHTMLVGTGETPSTLNFYKKCGFIYSHRIKDFFTDNYDSAIIEDGITLKDMVYLKREIG